jgi:hypothetical protein
MPAPVECNLKQDTEQNTCHWVAIEDVALKFSIEPILQAFRASIFRRATLENWPALTHVSIPAASGWADHGPTSKLTQPAIAFLELPD